MLLAGLLGVPLEGQMHWWSAQPHSCPVEEKRGQLFDTFYSLLLTIFKLFLILVTAGFSPLVFAVGRWLRRCCFPPLHFSLGDSGRALLSVAPHHLPQASAAKSRSHRKWQVHKVGVFSHQPNPRLVWNLWMHQRSGSLCNLFALCILF